MSAHGGNLDEAIDVIAQLRAERKGRRASANSGGLPVASIRPVAPKRQRSTPAHTRLAMPAEDRIEDELRLGLQRHWHHLTESQRRSIMAAVTSGLGIRGALTR